MFNGLARQRFNFTQTTRSTFCVPLNPNTRAPENPSTLKRKSFLDINLPLCLRELRLFIGFLREGYLGNLREAQGALGSN